LDIIFFYYPIIMTVNEIRTLYKFNYWANHRILDVARTVPSADYMKNLGSSHGGIHGTLVHIMSAEEIWLKRWKGEVTAGLHKPDEFSTFDSVTEFWKNIELSMMSFCDTLKGDQDISRIISYKDIKGNSYSQPLNQLMLHLVNHSTYHRGQVVTMLRQVNITPVGTDLIAFYRQTYPST
jgi:uncharacterized damage-inducible protein DinB